MFPDLNQPLRTLQNDEKSIGSVGAQISRSAQTVWTSRAVRREEQNGARAQPFFRPQ